MSMMNGTAPPLVILPFNSTSTRFNRNASCEYFGYSVDSEGLFEHGDLLHHMLPFLLIILGAAILLKTVLHRLLRPLNQPRFVSEMLTGIILGPSIIRYVHGGESEYYASLFLYSQGTILNFLEFLSLSLYAYVVGVRTDIAVIRSSGRLPWFIGITAFVFPITVAYISYASVKGNFPAKPAEHLFHLCPLVANTSFHVVSILLEDLNLLNSELGRIAMSSSLISSLCSWIFRILMNFYVWMLLLKKGPVAYILSLTFRVVLAACIVYGLRPVTFWVIRNIPEGNSMKESQFFFMTCMLFGVLVVSESMGYGAVFGTMILGLVVPPGPPLGSGIVERLNLFVSTVLLPSYIVNAGHFVDVVLLSKTAANYASAVLLIVVGPFLAKIAAAVVLSRFCRMPYRDAFTLGLIVSSQGFFDVIYYKRALTYTQLNGPVFTITTLVVVFNAAIATPLIRHLYDPSKRYLSYKRRTIQHSVHENELRILVCMHEEEEVYSIMNVLKASHSTRKTPLAVYVLNLMELVGRDQPLLINHQFHTDRSSTVTRTDRIISAFRQFEQHYYEGLKHQHFTAIAPFASMHDDICTLALDKSASLLIIPFQKYNESPGRTEVKRNVLDKAPCSVGILVDKKIIAHWRTDHSAHDEGKFRVCVIFLGGADSREALAYGMRMAENPEAISLTVIRLIAEDEFMADMVETKLDAKLINQMKTLLHEDSSSTVEYREVMVKDGANTMQVLRSLEDQYYDLILVGRRFENDSPVVAGFSDWNSVPELGIVGDILASSDMKSNASVLVVQQQSVAEDFVMDYKKSV